MAAKAAATEVKAHTCKKPSRKPFPEHLPRERVMIPGPICCESCGSAKLAKLGEDITETLEVIPRQWKVIQYVREKRTSVARFGLRKKLCAPRDYAQLAEGRVVFSAPELSEGGRSYGSVLNIILIFFQAHLA